MATTNVLLREDIDNLGGRGEIVKVKAGYARNFLLPRGLAITATKGNIKQVEQERAALLRKEAKERSTAEMQAEQMRGISLSFERRSGEHGILYGSVTTMDIADALRAKGYEVDRKRLTLPESIKELGDYIVRLKLHREVTLDLPVEVLGEGGVRAEKKGETETATESTTNETDAGDAATETAEA